MSSLSRRKRRANAARARHDKVSVKQLRAYVKRRARARPAGALFLLAVLAASFAAERGALLVIVAGLFGASVAGFLWFTSDFRCPVCRGPLTRGDRGVTCTHCGVHTA